MTNEERFIASCDRVGEADVRHKLDENRYSAGKALWAANWLDRIEGAKSEATKAEEGRTRLAQVRSTRHLGLVVSILVLASLLTSAVLYVKFG